MLCEWMLDGWMDVDGSVVLGGVFYVRCFRSDCMYGDMVARSSYGILSMAIVDATVHSLMV